MSTSLLITYAEPVKSTAPADFDLLLGVDQYVLIVIKEYSAASAWGRAFTGVRQQLRLSLQLALQSRLTLLSLVLTAMLL